MHLEYFGLAKPPFAGEPDTEIFFPEADRTALLRRIYADLQNGSLVIRLTGAEGSGKTLLCLLLAHLLPAQFQAVYLASPAGSFDELLQAACQELGQMPQTDMSAWLRRQLEQCQTQGKKLLLLIDQAEQMFPAALERLLRTVFAAERMTLQVIFAGRPSLDARVAQLQAYCGDMKIPPGHQLAPLTEEELGAYLDFRLKTAGLPAADSGRAFSGEAVRKIFKLANGNLRTVHLLADTALQRVCAADRYFPVQAADVAALEGNAPGGSAGGKKAWLSGRTWKLLAAAVLLFFAALLFRYSDVLWRSGEDAAKQIVRTVPVKPAELLPDKIRLNSEPELPPEPEQAEPTAEPAQTEAPPPEPTGQPAAAQVSAAAADVQELPAPPPFQERAEEEQVPEEEPLETPPATPPVQTQQPAPERKIIELAPGMRKTKVKPKSALAVQAPLPTATADNAAPPQADQLYQELLAAGRLLKNSRGKGRCTIQLLTLSSQDATEKIKEMIVREEYLEHRSRLKILRRSSSPAVIFVFYGSYASMEEAKAAVDNMPLFLRKHHPYALPVADALLKTGN